MEMVKPIKAFFTVAAIAAGMLCLVGCRTTEHIIVERVEHDTLRAIQTFRDSIYVGDSTVIHEGRDTIIIEHYSVKYRDRWHTDTLYRVRIDSVPYEQPYPVDVPAELTWWQQTRMHVGGVAIWIVIIWLIVWTIGKIKKIW